MKTYEVLTEYGTGNSVVDIFDTRTEAEVAYGSAVELLHEGGADIVSVSLHRVKRKQVAQVVRTTAEPPAFKELKKGTKAKKVKKGK